MNSVGSELLNEIERIAAKRERWRGYATAAGPEACFEPALTLMTMAIDNGKKAVMGDDPVFAIAALQALKDFSDED